MRYLKNLWARLFGRRSPSPTIPVGVQGGGPKKTSVKK